MTTRTVWRKDSEAAAKRPKAPCRNVQWHIHMKCWVVYVKRSDRTVKPSRLRKFQKNFADVRDAVAVRDAVDRLLRGGSAKQYGDGTLPPHISRFDIIQWCAEQGAIDPEEAPRLGKRLAYFDGEIPAE